MNKAHMIKQKIKDFKRKLLKTFQAKLRNFLSTEFRTSEEIQKDTMDAYVRGLERVCGKRFLGEGDKLSLFVGEVSYLTDKNEKNYYYASYIDKWCSLDGEVFDGEEVKSISDD